MSDKNDKAWIVEKLLNAHGDLYNPLEAVALVLSHDMIHDGLNDSTQEMLHEAYNLMDESISLIHGAIEEVDMEFEPVELMVKFGESEDLLWEESNG